MSLDDTGRMLAAAAVVPALMLVASAISCPSTCRAIKSLVRGVQQAQKIEKARKKAAAMVRIRQQGYFA